MYKLGFDVYPEEYIVVRLEGQYILRREWIEHKSFSGNLSSAAAEIEQVLQRMSETGGLAAKVGHELAMMAAKADEKLDELQEEINERYERAWAAVAREEAEQSVANDAGPQPAVE